MTKKAALAERTRLKEKSATLGTTRANAAREIKAAEAVIADLTQQRRGLLKEQAHGDASASGKVAAIDADIQTQEREIERHRELVEIARRELERVKQELRRLYSTAPAAFLDEAQAATDAAMGARERALAAFAEADAADQAARKAWAPVIEGAKEAGTGGYGKGSLGRMPGRPTLFQSGNSELGIRALKSAPPPCPEFAREPRMGGIASLVPAKFRQVLGIPEPPPREPAERESREVTVWER